MVSASATGKENSTIRLSPALEEVHIEYLFGRSDGAVEFELELSAGKSSLQSKSDHHVVIKFIRLHDKTLYHQKQEGSLGYNNARCLDRANR